MSDQTTTTAGGSISRPARLLRRTLTGLLGLLYALIIWTAVFYLMQMAQVGISGYGWLVLLLPVIVPMLIFAAVLGLTRRRGIGAFVIAMLAGLGLSAVFWLDTLSYAIRNGADLLG